MIVGHDKTLAVLERDLPPVTLLIGPHSVGKWTMARHLVTHHHIHPADALFVESGLTIDGVRTVIALAHRAPVGAYKVVVSRLDTAVSINALSGLLKVLEEPPATCRFILTSPPEPLSTIRSRATVFRLGALTPDELRTVLIGQGVAHTLAGKVATRGGGVKEAMLKATADKHRPLVLALVRSLASRDAVGFDKTVKDMTADARFLLTILLEEALLDAPAMFSTDDFCGLHTDRAKVAAMLRVLLTTGGLTARLGVRAALEPYLSLT